MVLVNLCQDILSRICVLQANINIRAIAQGCSEYNITVVLKREDCIRALRAVHSRFYHSKTTIAMGIVGPGLIGGTLLDQLRDQVCCWMDFACCLSYPYIYFYYCQCYNFKILFSCEERHSYPL